MKEVWNRGGGWLKPSQPVAKTNQPHSITKRTPTSKPHLSKKRITLVICIYKVFTSYPIGTDVFSYQSERSLFSVSFPRISSYRFLFSDSKISLIVSDSPLIFQGLFCLSFCFYKTHCSFFIKITILDTLFTPVDADGNRKHRLRARRELSRACHRRP